MSPVRFCCLEVLSGLLLILFNTYEAQNSEKIVTHTPCFTYCVLRETHVTACPWRGRPRPATRRGGDRRHQGTASRPGGLAPPLGCSQPSPEAPLRGLSEALCSAGCRRPHLSSSLSSRCVTSLPMWLCSPARNAASLPRGPAEAGTAQKTRPGPGRTAPRRLRDRAPLFSLTAPLAPTWGPTAFWEGPVPTSQGVVILLVGLSQRPPLLRLTWDVASRQGHTHSQEKDRGLTTHCARGSHLAPRVPARPGHQHHTGVPALSSHPAKGPGRVFRTVWWQHAMSCGNRSDVGL